MSNLELNKGDNFIFCVDVSGSMSARDTPSGASRIDYLKEKIASFIGEAGKYDDDGVDLVTFGHAVTVKPKLTPANASAVLHSLTANESATATDKVIAKAYDLHKAGGYKQSVVFVATDGAPSDGDAVKDVIRKIAGELKDEHEFAISFLLVGKDDGIRAYTKELDDGLNAKHDIVDCKELDEVDFVSAFAGALHD
jgi:Mg-chelatase subunit ChlD